MSDFHVRQFDGGPTACDGRNCAAASTAMAIAGATGGRIKLTSDAVRTLAGVSCVPGEHSGSGGLFIGDVIRVVSGQGASIDYGGPSGGPYTRWPTSTLETRLRAGSGAILLGDYDQLPSSLRVGTFLGDHSTYVDGIRIANGQVQVHWHDPLARAGVWIALSVAVAYWQKPGGAVSGFAGFVRLAVARETLMPNVKPGGQVLGTGKWRNWTPQHSLINTAKPGTRYANRPANETLTVFGVIDLVDANGVPIDIDGKQPPVAGRNEVYLVDGVNPDGRPFGASCYALRSQIDFTPSVADASEPTVPQTITVGGIIYERR